MREDDTVEEVAHVMDHDTVLFFSPDGICRALKAYQIPQSSRTAAGTPLTQARSLTDCPLGSSATFPVSLILAQQDMETGGHEMIISGTSLSGTASGHAS